MAGLVFVALLALNVLRVRRLTPYLVLGVALWFFVHESGVHATIAGVLLAFAIPTRTRINAQGVLGQGAPSAGHFDRTETGDLLVLTSKGQQEAIIGLERASEGVTAPLLRLEHALHGFSAFVVMPLFALSNAGVGLERIVRRARDARRDSRTCRWEAPRDYRAAPWRRSGCGWPRCRGVSWTTLHGCAWLGGIGFTMSLFIATLAFEGTSLLDSAKVGILGGSVLSGVVGAIVLRLGSRATARRI